LLSLPGMDDAAYRNFLATNYGASAVDALHALYPPSQFPTPTDAAYLLLTELVFGCPAEALARAAGSRGASHLYLGTRSTRADGYATHGGEFPYLMDTLEERGIPVDQPAMDLRSALQSGFATLAASPTLAPLVDAGSQGNFSWPAYDPARPEVVEFGDQVRVINDYRNGRCATLAALLPP
ncbi:MAG: Carboxylesterase family, partial [Pseudomonadota bacterium]